MTPAELDAIEARRALLDTEFLAPIGTMSTLAYEDIPALVAEVRRLMVENERLQLINRM